MIDVGNKAQIACRFDHTLADALQSVANGLRLPVAEVVRRAVAASASDCKTIGEWADKIHAQTSKQNPPHE